ncbi:MAG: hypothetical protein ACRDE2_00105 [Chitinophagaceae bacterium]
MATATTQENNNLSERDNYTSPLAQNVEEKPYAASKDQPIGQIPEPSFPTPDFGKEKDFFEAEKINNKNSNRQNNSQLNSNMIGSNDMTQEEKRVAAESMATTFIQGYSILCKYAAKWVMIKPEKVTKLIREGKIDPNILYYAPGDVQATAPRIIEAYNQEMLDMLVVSDEWAESVRPILIRIFIKRGIGMSDEAQLLWIVGQDIFTKGALLFSIKKQSNDFLKSFSLAVPNKPIKETAEPARAPVINKENKAEKREEPKQRLPVKKVKPSTALEELAPEGFFDEPAEDKRYKVPKFGKGSADRLTQISNSSSNSFEPTKKKRGRPKKG